MEVKSTKIGHQKCAIYIRSEKVDCFSIAKILIVSTSSK